MCPVLCTARGGAPRTGELIDCGVGLGIEPSFSKSSDSELSSSLPFPRRQTPGPSLEVRAPCPYLECRCEPTAVAAVFGPCPTVAPARDLPAPLSLAPGRRQFCGPGAPPRSLVKERVSPRCVPPLPTPPGPSSKLPLFYQGVAS